MLDIKLIAFDLDGTLLGEDNQISQENFDTLTKAAEAGVNLVIATGRNYSEIPQKVRELPVRYFITANGSFVYDREADAVLYSNCLTLEQAEYLMKMGRDFKGYAMYYIDRRVYVTTNFDEYMELLPKGGVYEQLARDYIPCDNLAGEKDADIYTQKVVLFFKEESQRDAMLEKMTKKDCRRQEFEITSSYRGNVELNPKGSSKGIGLQVLMETLSLTADRVAAIGDSTNDLSLLWASGHAFSVANALPEVKSQVPSENIMPSQEDNGVSHMVRRVLSW